jgi:hypothetical protein
VLFDGVQVVVRTWKDDYTTGLPSLVSLLIVYGVIFLVSVVAVVVGDRAARGD